MNAVLWGHDLASALIQIDDKLSTELGEKVSHDRLYLFGDKVKSAMQSLWNEAPMDIFNNT